MEHRITTAATRLGTGMAAMATLAWLLWPTSDWKLEPEPLAMFLTTLGGWLAAEIIPVIAQAKTPHRLDVELLERLQALITPDHLAFLRDQDFGGTISREPLDAFYQLADQWRGQPYEFVDKKVQPAFAALHRTVEDFVDLVLTRTHRRGNYLSAKTDQDLDEGVSPQTRQHMRDLNAKAGELHKKFEAFYRLARPRLQG